MILKERVLNTIGICDNARQITTKIISKYPDYFDKKVRGCGDAKAAVSQIQSEVGNILSGDKDLFENIEEGNYIQYRLKDKDPIERWPTTSLNTVGITIVGTRKWWKRINQHVFIDKFPTSKSDLVILKSLLGNEFLTSRVGTRFVTTKEFIVTLESFLYNNPFYNEASFQRAVVATCVVNSEDLFTMLDAMGISNRVSPPVLMHELYDLCKDVNPFLTFENVQKLADVEVVDIPDDPSEIDTIVVPVYNEAFVDKICWYPVRIHESMIQKIKYLVMYKHVEGNAFTDPIDSVDTITHIASIKSIEQYEDTDEYVLHLSEPAEELLNPINLICKNKAKAHQSFYYTSIKRLIVVKGDAF